MIGRILSGLFAIAGAAGFAQFPAFYQQYLQRLGGRLDQARIDVGQLAQDAQNLGQTVQGHIDELKAAGTEEAQQAAQRELDRVDNANQLEAAYDALATAEPLNRPVAFVERFDADVAQQTMDIFQPAFPATPEAIVYATVGMAIALLLLTGGEVGGRSMWRMIRGY